MLFVCLCGCVVFLFPLFKEGLSDTFKDINFKFCNTGDYNSGQSNYIHIRGTEYFNFVWGGT